METDQRILALRDDLKAAHAELEQAKQLLQDWHRWMNREIREAPIGRTRRFLGVDDA